MLVKQRLALAICEFAPDSIQHTHKSQVVNCTFAFNI